jgi:hypothetical protein
VAETERQFPGLGTLRWDNQLQWWESYVTVGEFTDVAFCLLAEKSYGVFAAPEELFPIGVEYLACARSAESQCRQQIANDLLECFNENWTFTNRAGDGPKPVSREEFIRAVTLSAMHLFADGSAAWYYDDGDLFGGHSIEIWVTKEREFKDAHLAG